VFLHKPVNEPRVAAVNVRITNIDTHQLEAMAISIPTPINALSRTFVSAVQ
jgi:hypothetical protein